MIEENFYPTDYDTAWKDMLRDFLLPMLSSVLPELYAEIDQDTPPVFLDKEANDTALELSSDNDSTIREVDLLVDLTLKNKVRGSVRILLHCEVQGRGGNEDLNYRMYCYKNLLELRYKKPIVALAIITQPLPAAQMSGEYHWSNFGTENIYRFNVVKVFEASEELVKSGNPFDIAQLAAARAWRARDNEFTRLEYLKEFIKLLIKKGFERDERLKIMKFLETMAKIRKPEYRQNYLEFVDEEKEKEENSTMLMIEERAIERGMAQGITLGRNEGITLGKNEGISIGKLEVARRMAQSQMPIQQISSLVGMPEEEIRKAVSSV